MVHERHSEIQAAWFGQSRVYRERQLADLSGNFLGDIMQDYGVVLTVDNLQYQPLMMAQVTTPGNEGSVVLLRRQRGFLRYGIVHNGNVIELVAGKYIPGAFENQQDISVNILGLEKEGDVHVLAVLPHKVDADGFLHEVRSQYLRKNLDQYAVAHADKEPDLLAAASRTRLDRAIEANALSRFAIAYLEKTADRSTQSDLPVDEASLAMLQAMEDGYLMLILGYEMKILGHFIVEGGVAAPIGLFALELQASHWLGGVV